MTMGYLRHEVVIKYKAKVTTQTDDIVTESAEEQPA